MTNSTTEALVNEGNTAKAVRRINPGLDNEVTVYRGWMLRPEYYTSLYEELIERNLQLINSPAGYRHCHYLPESYHTLAGDTPRSIWLPIVEASFWTAGYGRPGNSLCFSQKSFTTCE